MGSSVLSLRAPVLGGLGGIIGRAGAALTAPLLLASRGLLGLVPAALVCSLLLGRRASAGSVSGAWLRWLCPKDEEDKWDTGWLGKKSGSQT